MQLPRCKICRTPERRRLIDASYAEGMSAAAIARRETASGFSISAVSVTEHLKKHYVAADHLPPGVAKQKRDLALIVQERTVDWLESTIHEDGTPIGPGDPGWKDALGPGLAAQKILDAREARTDDKKVMIAFAELLSGLAGGVQLAPANLRALPDGQVIEGECRDVTDGD